MPLKLILRVAQGPCWSWESPDAGQSNMAILGLPRASAWSIAHSARYLAVILIFMRTPNLLSD